MGLYDRQEKLNLKTNVSILICGCGGIGYWVAKYAAMSGIEKLILYDSDVLEEHNLNRLDLPDSVLGKNKAQITRTVINEIRPFATVQAFPYKLTKGNYLHANWFVDCTDNQNSQITNQEIAHSNGSKYVKAGYNGERMTLSDCVAEWGEAPDGYTIIPSWVVPASIIAALTVAKIMKYEKSEVSTELKKLFVIG